MNSKYSYRVMRIIYIYMWFLKKFENELSLL